MGWHITILPGMASRRSARASALLFHRGHEHSGRFADGARNWAWLMSLFSHGTHGDMAARPANAVSAGCYANVIRDIEDFVGTFPAARHPAAEHGRRWATAWRRSRVAAWVHDYAPPIRAMILATPAFRVKLYVRLRSRAAAWQARGKAFIKSYVKAKMLTHDPARPRNIRMIR